MIRDSCQWGKRVVKLSIASKYKFDRYDTFNTFGDSALPALWHALDKLPHFVG